ncbi:MAG: sulfatase [Acidobacteriota bacterium]|nr:sulfatase [Acidobacteriota bacterium]
MNRRGFLSTLAGGSFAFAQTSRRATPKLNFVFVLIDDMGWRDVSYNGSQFYETPNIDRLAAQGMKFTNAYAACPVCSPTRASIMTGKYPARLGLTNFLPGRHQLPYSKLLAPVSRQQLPLEEVTIAEALKPSGYVTAAMGKWHLGGPDFFPEKQGFDVNVGGTDAGSPKSHFYPQWEGRPPITAAPGAYLADRLTDSAEEFIGKNAAKPFLLYLAHYGVHIPLEGKQDLIARYQTRIKPGQLQNNATYAAMVQSVDESVGRLMKKLEDLKIADHTAIFFMSDNGGLSAAEYKGQYATSNSPLREGKGFLYEGGIREPMLIKWAGVVKEGSSCDVPVISTDFYPTMLEMAGIAKDIGNPQDGVSMVPLLKQSGLPKRDALYWHYPHYSNQGGRPGAAIRQGDYKLIEYYEDGRTEMFNLRDDIGEAKNLAAQMPEKAAGLKRKLDDWLKELNPEMPAPNPAYDAARETEGLAPAIRAQRKAAGY